MAHQANTIPAPPTDLDTFPAEDRGLFTQFDSIHPNDRGGRTVRCTLRYFYGGEAFVVQGLSGSTFDFQRDPIHVKTHAAMARVHAVRLLKAAVDEHNRHLSATGTTTTGEKND